MDAGTGSYSKGELEKILKLKAKRTINKFVYTLIRSILIFAGFITFLVITMVNRRGDIYYIINNLLLCSVFTFMMGYLILVFIRLNKNLADLPLKRWLGWRINSLSRSLKHKIAYFIFPFFLVLSLFSVRVYYAHKPFFEVINTKELVSGLLTSLVAGLSAGYVSLIISKKRHRRYLEYLEDLYKRLDNMDTLS